MKNTVKSMKIIFYEVSKFDLSKLIFCLRSKENCIQYTWNPRSTESIFLHAGIVEVSFMTGGQILRSGECE